MADCAVTSKSMSGIVSEVQREKKKSLHLASGEMSVKALRAVLNSSSGHVGGAFGCPPLSYSSIGPPTANLTQFVAVAEIVLGFLLE